MSKIYAAAIIGRAISYNWLLKGTPPPVSSFILLCSFSTIFTTPTSSTRPPPSSSVITNQRVKLSKTITTHQCDSNFDDAVNLFNCMAQMRPLPPISNFNKALRTITKMSH
ncbi:hypothetical protein CsSME_00033621 [Camellia sinensis var. sinensis]